MYARLIVVGSVCLLVLVGGREGGWVWHRQLEAGQVTD
jgi:hypothetical protein